MIKKFVELFGASKSSAYCPDGRTCAFTGHRPQNLPFRFNESDKRCIALKKQLRKLIVQLIEQHNVTHFISGMAKTREIYVAYRQAGYSKKFRQEHEAEILLHQAAKNAFDDMGVKKLPKVKELQTDYAKLLEEKKKIYAEYRRSREEMRELLTAKANVDRLLKMDEEQKQEKEKDHDQR